MDNINMNSISYTEESVLVVEDDKEILETVKDMLKHLGFTTHGVSSGEEALDFLKKEACTFLLTDIKMVGISGLELIERIRAERLQITVICMTGYSREYSYVDVVNAGATDFINKPFGIEELEAKMRRAIIERNLRLELNKLSITDSLTGLFNQRHFYVRLKEEIRRAQRLEGDLGLILLDLDGFKEYNDRHGHLAGDTVLKGLGGIINRSIRQGVDSGYRYGGDEFAVLVVGADCSVAMSIADRIGKALMEEWNVGITIGYAGFSEGLGPEAFVNEADRELYRAKGEKKNPSLVSV